MNVELMKHFARLQGQDDQGMIRTNTTVCIGKIAPFINPALRQRILLSAFPKAMRDPFPMARLSGIIALANTDRFYTLKDVATKVLPCLSTLCVDPEKDVRDEAFKTIKQFLLKLEKVSETPEMALEMEKDVSSCTLDVKNETSWTSWAMTSLSAKVTGYKTKNQQPSVALNTQPLGPPPSMNSSPGKDEKKNEAQPSQQQQQHQQHKPKDSFNEPSKPKDSSNNSYGNETGWSLDDNEWKDLDDDDNDIMEPLEPVQTTNSNKSDLKPSQSNSDWSSWNNSFEDVKANQSDDQYEDMFSSKPSKPANTVTKSANLKPNSSQPQLPMASSYNWSSQSSNNLVKNEEDLFNSLVKDTAGSNKV